ncbi:MAG TPA: ABC transporter permease subunit [Polyangiales bacterium]
MNAVWTIAKREVFSFFVSPIAYVVMTVWLLFFGIVFYILALVFAQQPGGAESNLLTAFFGGTTLFYLPLLVFTPVMTMRLLAEERSSGTIEPLLTAPVSEVSVVLGKYFAALTFWCVLWAPTLSYVWLVARAGKNTVDWGAIGATYLGLFSVGVFYMAVGLFMSAIARNQIVAAMLTFLVLGGLFVLGLAGYANVGDEMRAIFEYLGLWTQMAAFSKGIVDTRYLVYDASIAAAALFLSVRALSSGRGN